jgi:O-acetyl-ADP-ribose deacetylase (regulator of RNase III)
MEGLRFILCDPKKVLADAWRDNIQRHLPASDAAQFTVREGVLDDVPDTFDCIVAAANSFGIMNGASDLVISNMFCPGNIEAVIDTVQRHLHRTWNGFQPVGTCEIVPMAGFGQNRFSCKYIAHTPTMRTPMNVRWDKEVVYRCFWSLLNSIARHNESQPAEKRIRSVLCFGLATGVGAFPVDVCAAQMILAWKNFNQRATTAFRPIDWKAAYGESLDIEETHRVASMHL